MDDFNADRPAYAAVPVSRAASGRGAPLAPDESLVELRCSVVISRGDQIVLIRRGDRSDADWVLPGGRPRAGESLGSCARREALEETGLRVHPHRIGLVGEVAGRGRERLVEVVFIGLLDSRDASPPGKEPGTRPTWVPVADLAQLNLRPPIAGYLPALIAGRSHTAAYLGNLWRPTPADPGDVAGDQDEVDDGFDDDTIVWPT